MFEDRFVMIPEATIERIECKSVIDHKTPDTQKPKQPIFWQTFGPGPPHPQMFPKLLVLCFFCFFAGFLVLGSRASQVTSQ